MSGAADRDLLPLPRALALGLWTAAYLRGDCGPDDAVEQARGRGHRHVEHTGIDLFDWMTDVRRLPLASVRPVLPVPGRIAGLVGPPRAVETALEAGQALVVTAGGIAASTLVPVTETIGSAGAEGHVVRWLPFPAPPSAPMPPPLGAGSREQFLDVLRRAARSTRELDLVPEEPIAVAHLPAGWTAALPAPGMDGPTLHLLTLAARTLLLTETELMLADPLDTARTRTPGLGSQASRAGVLRDLHDAAREAVIDIAGRAASA